MKECGATATKDANGRPKVFLALRTVRVRKGAHPREKKAICQRKTSFECPHLVLGIAQASAKARTP
jgi:hypothetical protein